MSIDANQDGIYTVFPYSSLEREEYWVKISYQPTTINQSVSSSSQEYVTRHYLSAQEASMNARGWKDCMFYYKTCKQIPNDNKDSYENKYRELLDEFKNNRFERDINNSQVSMEELELAYREGWENKLEELNNGN
jgi:hypothetical protein